MNRSDLIRILSALLAMALIFVLTACAAKPVEPAPEPEVTAPKPALEPAPEPVLRDDLVGITMPTRDLQRWVRDGKQMKSLLEEAGYEVDLQFAENDPSMQISQLENMVKNGARVLIISSIDGDALGTVLEQAKEAGCAVIAYDRPIGSDAVSYYTTFDNYSVGAAQGQFIVDRLDLVNAGDRVYNLEIIGGSPDDGCCGDPFYFGAMEVLNPFIEKGTLNVVSGQTAFENVATEGWSSEKAQERFENLLSVYYGVRPLHAVLASNRTTAQGVTAALEKVYSNDVYPIITGEDRDLNSVDNTPDEEWEEGFNQAQYIVDALDLDNKSGRFHIEVVTGDPGFKGAFFEGAMSVLRPYLNSNKLFCFSRLNDFQKYGTKNWSAEKAEKSFEKTLCDWYVPKPLHAVLATNDSTAQGVAAALETTYSNDIYPIITGQDCDIVSVRNILDGKQTMSIFKDTRVLAAKTVEMAEAIMRGETVPTNAMFTTVDGAHRFPAFYCDPTPVTKDNVQEMLIDSGYYTWEEILTDSE